MTKLTYVCDNSRHLICKPYSISNLHRMAAELDIPRHWYHAGNFPHYDIPVRRLGRIKSQCAVVSSREILRIIKEARNEADITEETRSCAPHSRRQGSSESTAAA